MVKVDQCAAGSVHTPPCAEPVKESSSSGMVAYMSALGSSSPLESSSIVDILESPQPGKLGVSGSSTGLGEMSTTQPDSTRDDEHNLCLLSIKRRRCVKVFNLIVNDVDAKCFLCLSILFYFILFFLFLGLIRVFCFVFGLV